MTSYKLMDDIYKTAMTTFSQIDSVIRKQIEERLPYPRREVKLEHFCIYRTANDGYAIEIVYHAKVGYLDLESEKTIKVVIKGDGTYAISTV